MADSDFVSLLHLNPATARFMTWTVRVVHGHVEKFSFVTRKGDILEGSKFVCYLVSANEEEYVQGVVRHSWRDPNFIQEQKDRFRDGTVWNIMNVQLEVNGRAGMNGSPYKNIVLLEPPTIMIPVLEWTAQADNIAHRISPTLRISDLVQLTVQQSVDI